MEERRRPRVEGEDLLVTHALGDRAQDHQAGHEHREAGHDGDRGEPDLAWWRRGRRDRRRHGRCRAQRAGFPKRWLAGRRHRGRRLVSHWSVARLAGPSAATGEPRIHAQRRHGPEQAAEQVGRVMLIEGHPRDPDQDHLDHDRDHQGDPPSLVSRGSPEPDRHGPQDREALEDVPRGVAIHDAGDPVAIARRTRARGELLDALAAGRHGHEQDHDDHGLVIVVLPHEPQDQPDPDPDQREVRRLGDAVPERGRAVPALKEGEDRLVEREDDVVQQGGGQGDERGEADDRQDQQQRVDLILARVVRGGLVCTDLSAASAGTLTALIRRGPP